MGSKLCTEMRTALGGLRTTAASELIPHIPQVTLAPLMAAIVDLELKLTQVDKVKSGAARWEPWMGDWSPKAGKEAERPVLAVVNTIKKFSR